MADYPCMHLLVYGSPKGTQLHEKLDMLSDRRKNRAEKMVELLAEHQMPLDYADICARAGKSVGRPHIAFAMQQAGYVASMEEAFQKWIGTGCPCYVPHECMTFREAVALTRASGFVPVLAHPYQISEDTLWLRTMVKAWADTGLMGIEVYHPSAAKKGFHALERIASDYGLIVTGGSDYHREHDKHGAIGCMADEWRNAEEQLSRLCDAMQKEQKEY